LMTVVDLCPPPGMARLWHHREPVVSDIVGFLRAYVLLGAAPVTRS
jgi:hypothetical protein